ncbi:putative pectinesterase 56 [Raphanus sativus]|uniref:Probable pectinesterase 56 n=1 Tax=Raphanus sativus TaxID=3726 RepID=A0A6J0M5R9_RAPSA|nr:probable pectinesterase 56 [Raphanus sativus]KAJ4913397.1 putative pectinesterase 56 [Raphanus sativus]
MSILLIFPLHETILTGNLNGQDGASTFHSSTLGSTGLSGEGFVARDICIQDTAGRKKGQAVALRVSSDRAVFYLCRIDANHDTLYAYKYQQFYRECQITGTVDFICGDATAVFQNCQIEGVDRLKDRAMQEQLFVK